MKLNSTLAVFQSIMKLFQMNICVLLYYIKQHILLGIS